MLKFETTTQFRRDIKLIEKRKYDLSLLDEVIQTLIEEKQLDQKYRDHSLKGDYTGCRECHILPDWLFIYRVDKGRLILVATRTGTHSDIY
jgi:mRNA interferase YafQ